LPRLAVTCARARIGPVVDLERRPGSSALEVMVGRNPHFDSRSIRCESK